MKRKVFFSFHFEKDAWRAAQVRNMGAIEGNAPVSDNDWEKVKRGGDSAIEKWIDSQLEGKSCVVVLIGEYTYQRPWVRHEISRGWNMGKGVVGIDIHNLRDSQGRQSNPGNNPFEYVTFNSSGSKLSSVVTRYSPPEWSSESVYAAIKANINQLVEAAIYIRSNYK
jgi:hypothetical protein